MKCKFVNRTLLMFFESELEEVTDRLHFLKTIVNPDKNMIVEIQTLTKKLKELS